MCLSLQPKRYFSSVYISDLGTNWGLPGVEDSGSCRGLFAYQGSVCMVTGGNNIFGTYWQTTGPDSRRSPELTKCNGTQYVDIYHIALPGEHRKPYSITVVQQFDHAGAVNWTTWSFNADKVNVVQEIVSQYGNGLNDAQVAAISQRPNL
jgi:hypothetical protein